VRRSHSIVNDAELCDRFSVDWNDLRFLLAIARAGSLAAAAREIGVQHSTLSRRLTALETALGTRMFARGPEGLTPTVECVEALRIAREISDKIDWLQNNIGDRDARVEGMVRVTTSEAQSTYLAPKFSVLRERHPQLDVELLGINRKLDIVRGEADIGLRAAFLNTDPDLVAKKLICFGWALYAAESYVDAHGDISMEDLTGHDLIVFDSIHAGAPFSQWIAEHECTANPMVRRTTMLGVLHAAIAGLGLAALPCWMGDTEPRLRRVSGVLGTHPFYLVARADIARLARVRAVMAFIQEVFEDDRALFTGERHGVSSLRTH
jgi:DNA-binding transcriptional LysR family regulator